MRRALEDYVELGVYTKQVQQVPIVKNGQNIGVIQKNLYRLSKQMTDYGDRIGGIPQPDICGKCPSLELALSTTLRRGHIAVPWSKFCSVYRQKFSL